MMKGRSVVLIPTPGAGHLVAMIELAKQILHHTHNLSITILIIRPPSFSPFASSSISQHLDAVAASGLDINSVELHQAALSELEDQANHLAFLDNQKSAVSEALTALQQTTTILAFIADLLCIATTTASLELGIPTFVFFTSGATTLCLFIYLPEMDRKSEQDFKDVTEKVEFPGSLPLPSSALPIFLQGKEEGGYQWVLRNAHLYSGLDGILVNSFNELQPRAIEALTDGLCCLGGRTPPVYSVGPLLDLGTAGSDSNGQECIKWLDQQPRSSVLFLCFGSMGAFPTEQIHEIARGLELSGQRFLWSLRVRQSELGPGFGALRDAELDEVLTAGFVERT
ncbi:hypothetical protein EJ110_NYTH09410 [Nymphaea thermarum]|nr:hypothetical protein EJ110_NYTH09410 [Nymphaea thermarum]